MIFHLHSGQNLSTLALARNKILTLDPGVFVNVNVTDLDLSYNRIQSLDPLLLSPLNWTLRTLKVGGNPLQVSHLWSSVLSARVNLTLHELDVADMGIGRDQHFQTDLFSFQKQLRKLNVSGSGLTFLPVEMVQSLPALKQLDLSRNQLFSLTDLTLSALSALPYLVRRSLSIIHLHLIHLVQYLYSPCCQFQVGL